MINAAKNGKGNIPSRLIYDLGVEQSLLSYWIKTGLVSPSIKKGKQGDSKTSTSLWSFNDLLEIQTILYLRGHGLSMQRVRKILKRIRDNNYPLHATNLVTDGQDVIINLDRKVIEILGETDQYLLLGWKDMVKSCLKINRGNAVKKKKLLHG